MVAIPGYSGMMWYLRTISVVPRPDAGFVAVGVLTYLVYLAAIAWQPLLFGQPVAPLPLAVAVYVIAIIARNVIAQARPDATHVWAHAAAIGTVLVLAWLTMTAESIWPVQKGVSIWLMSYAVILFTFIRWLPNDLHRLPSIWADGSPDAPKAMALVAAGYVIRAFTLAALARWGSEDAWVLFLTLGNVAFGFGVNWVIVMMILARLSERD